MQLDQTPFFRKTIMPWYDSTPACWVVIIAMIPVMAFAAGGIIVAMEEPEFLPHAWFPSLLLGLSGFLCVKVHLRVRARSRND